ncbi:hypothetical protein [Acidisphaera rubrifaciens]|uniref:General stress protein 17M-like domain-containing protein n=1 Tax=Acidisphaera rubrifaciens HS-AP3 TaxID=1231350 RepID=A0A0D6P6L2_9PROT|nr:hypothetical protein [Acidisphaera rubrifaciens]GAN77405.1 hypothetical protein Asru_0303_08 [Acidisphaera rubrifaciens HS-AP3]
MADQTTSPPLAASVLELQGVFPSETALRDAVARLSLAGFDRAELSVPSGVAGMDAAPPQTEVDQRQARTLGTSMAASSGAMVGAGLAAAAGIAVAPIAAAAVVGGLAAGAIAGAAASGAKSAEDASEQQRAAAGQLILTVRLRDRAQQGEVERAFKEAGATRWDAVERRAD